MTPLLDVVGIGNAIVDVLSPVADTVLHEHGLVKGSMRLCDTEEAERIYAAMGPGTEKSGGSAANTMAGIASLGGRAAFVGKVRDDQLGKVFGHDIRAAGVEFPSVAAASGPPTGRCLILITPDAERTLNTSLGIAGQLGPQDLPTDVVESARVTYLEGYLWEEPPAKEAFLLAIELTHGARHQVAMTLSDSFCVDRNRADFLELVRGPVDILFANEAELCSLFDTDDFDAALETVRGLVSLAAVTRSAAGSVLVAGDRTEVIPAAPANVVDTTGAGDLYAAGVLYGLTNGLDLAIAGRLGSLAAAEVISHVGARPEVDLAELAADLLARLS